MARMFNLGDVLELVVDGLHDSALAQQQNVMTVQQAPLHVAAGKGDQMHVALLKQLGHEPLTDVAFVAHELAEEPLGKGRDGFAIIHIAGRELAS